MRKAFFLLAWTMFLATALVSKSIASEARPNFLFVYTDDQRHDALGCVQRELGQNKQGQQARFSWLESPNLDRLASQGVRFRNAFVVTALCNRLSGGMISFILTLERRDLLLRQSRPYEAKR